MLPLLSTSNNEKYQERKNAPMDFKLRGKSLSVTQADVLRVTRDVSPASVDGRKKHFVKLHGRNYPIKQVVQLFSNLSSAVFTSQDAHRILSRLGFDVETQARVPNARTPARIDVTVAGVSENGASTHRDDGDVRKLLVVFHADEDGWQVASCPTLPGCHTAKDERAKRRSATCERPSGAIWRVCANTAPLHPPRPSFRLSTCGCRRWRDFPSCREMTSSKLSPGSDSRSIAWKAAT